MDPIADFIIRIKNAAAVRKAAVSVSYSRAKLAVAEKLQELGYVKGVEKRGKKVRRMIEVGLVYGEDGSSRIRGVKRLSKPGRRLYTGVRDIRPVRFGQGDLVMSTPKGILTGNEARKEKVGGEVLFEIW